MSEPTDPVKKLKDAEKRMRVQKSHAAKNEYQLRRIKTAKESIHAVFEMLGGPIGYFHWAQKNPDKFYDHFIRTLPLEAKLDVAVKSDFTDVLEAARKRIKSDELKADEATDAEIIAEIKPGESNGE